MDNRNMSASFLSICRSTSDETEQRDKIAGLASHVDGAVTKDESGISSRPGTLRILSSEHSARESFSTIVNASTCANLDSAKLIEGYVTHAQWGVFINNKKL